MKIIAALSVCLLAASISYGQNTPAPKKTADTKAVAKVKGSNIAGIIKNAKNRPMKGVEAFVYKADSTIIASGTTDADGKYGTNNVPPGTYFVKLIYPNGRKVLMVYGITIKTESIDLSLKADVPETDTMFSYDNVKPKPLAKSDEKKK